MRVGTYGGEDFEGRDEEFDHAIVGVGEGERKVRDDFRGSLGEGWRSMVLGRVSC